LKIHKFKIWDGAGRFCSAFDDKASHTITARDAFNVVRTDERQTLLAANSLSRVVSPDESAPQPTDHLYGGRARSRAEGRKTAVGARREAALCQAGTTQLGLDRASVVSQLQQLQARDPALTPTLQPDDRPAVTRAMRASAAGRAPPARTSRKPRRRRCARL